MADTPRETFRFGQCEVSVAHRELRSDGLVVPVGDRVFDILVTLIRGRGSVISKNRLISTVWPGRVIEENTLEGQISALRKALSVDRAVIRTVAGRGYQFVADLHTEASQPRSMPSVFLPASMSALIGRERDLAEVTQRITQHRLTTLVGTGGVGKTRLAVESARHSAEAFPDRVSIAELASVQSAEFVFTAILGAVGIAPFDANVTPERVAAALAGKRTLLVLDNCEHLLDATVALVTMLLSAAPSLTVLATSREPLRVAGEQVYRVESLDIPDEQDEDPDSIARCGAVRLLEERMEVGIRRRSSDARSALLKAKICRRLDGIPLAIELAAARVAAFGLAGVAERIDDRFALLTSGNRTALPRQQTLGAALDWSFTTLSAPEQAVLTRLCVFAGPFSIDAIQSIVTTEDLTAEALTELIPSLVDKSLVNADVSQGIASYRLLETTRAYALERLHEAGQVATFSMRHARFFLDRFRGVEAQWEASSTVDWSSECDPYLDDLRWAIQWSFSTNGDAELGIELVAAAVPFWTQRSHLQECLAAVTQALAHLGDDQTSSRVALKLHAAKGAALLSSVSNVGTGDAFTRTLEIATLLGDREYQLRALWGLWGDAYMHGPYQRSLQLAEQFASLCPLADDDPDRLVSERLQGIAYLCLGQLLKARWHLENMLTHYSGAESHSHMVRFVYDQQVTALSALAYVLWLQGFADQARKAMRRAEERARLIGHVSSTRYVQTTCIWPLLLLSGGIGALHGPIEAVFGHGAHGQLSSRQIKGQFWRGLNALTSGELQAYERVIAPSLRAFGEVQYAFYMTGFRSALCEALSHCGGQHEASRLIHFALERAVKSQDRSSLPELLRVRGEIILFGDETDTAKKIAESSFVAALEAARATGALAWELRAAMSLARLHRSQGRGTEARTLLRGVYARFTEGFDTMDLLAAERLLTELASEDIVQRCQ